MRRGFAAGLITAVTLTGTISATTAAATAAATTVASAPAAQLRYVALGDSYSAASGVLPPDPTAPIQCLRSSRNYPHLVAAVLGAALTDVSCGAAETGDYFEAQSPGVPAQLDALSSDTELVTMTIGGNDSGVFIGSILKCGAAAVGTLGTGSPCKDRYGDQFENTIRTTTYPSLVNALTAVHQRAPQARVAILGYPWIVPTATGCFTKMPVATGDVPYLRSLQTTLNDAVQRAAGATGSLYVDLSRASDGRDACQPIGTRWIEPVLQGTNPVVVHPNALGEAGMAAQALATLAEQPACAGTGPGACAMKPTRSPRTPTSTRIEARSAMGRTTLTARVRASGVGTVRGVRVSLQKRADHRWVKVRKVSSDASGTARVTLNPRRRSVYRWRFAGTPAYAPSTSHRKTVRP